MMAPRAAPAPPALSEVWRLCVQVRAIDCVCRAADLARPCPSIARLFAAPGGGWLTAGAAAATAAAAREISRRAPSAADRSGAVLRIVRDLGRSGHVEGADVAAAAARDGICAREVRAALLALAIAGHLSRVTGGAAEASRWRITPGAP
jgi:hypothetical protein